MNGDVELGEVGGVYSTFRWSLNEAHSFAQGLGKNFQRACSYCICTRRGVVC